MGFLGVEFMLVIFAVIMALGFLTTYIVAVQNNHVTPYLPYISDTGRNPPESCIFTIICSVSSFFLCLIVYVSFRPALSGLLSGGQCSSGPLHGCHDHLLWSISVCFKFFLSILATVVVVTAVVTGAISRNVPHSQAGVLHTLSTWSEWLSACTLTLFFLTLHTDFRRIQVNVFVQLRVNEADGRTYV
ncbi:hypothetical protein EMCRGX_G009030 [Ephydatia muelleri]